VVAAALAFTPAVGTAAPRGGGGHHAGARPAAVGHTHYAGAYHGAAHYGRGYSGAHYGRGYYGGAHYGGGYYGGYGRGYYGGYGWTPYLGLGLGYPYGYAYGPSVNNYYNTYPSYDYGVPNVASTAPVAPPLDYQSFYPAPAVAMTNGPAELNVILPAAGSVSFGGVQEQQAAGPHLYETPSINAGSKYSYTVQARWMQNGQPVTRTRNVQFQAGERINIDFTNPSNE
jgi:uncharacterized protein (TIGR03000 family)